MSNIEVVEMILIAPLTVNEHLIKMDMALYKSYVLLLLLLTNTSHINDNS